MGDDGCADLLIVDAAAIVLYFNVDLIAAMVGAQGNQSLLSLAALVALLGGLDAMGDGVAYEMDQRIGDLLDDAVIQVRLAAG